MMKTSLQLFAILLLSALLPAQTQGTGKTKQEEKKAKPKETVVEVAPPDEIPASADPADLRAMRGAQQMLQVEKMLADKIKSGSMKDIDMILSFEEISSWPYEDGLKGIPPAIKKLDDKKVVMTGFMLPIDEVENIKEFLLVQSLWSCCYGQPPDINGIVRVVMQGKARTDYQFDPIQITGTFRIIEAIEDGYCVDIYQLHADKVEVVKFN